MTLDDDLVRRLRVLLRTALELLPDPDAPVHARDPSRRSRWTGPQGLCGRVGRSPRLTDEVAEVTCQGCRETLRWDVWRWERCP